MFQWMRNIGAVMSRYWPLFWDRRVLRACESPSTGCFELTERVSSLSPTPRNCNSGVYHRQEVSRHRDASLIGGDGSYLMLSAYLYTSTCVPVYISHPISSGSLTKPTAIHFYRSTAAPMTIPLYLFFHFWVRIVPLQLCDRFPYYYASKFW